MNMNEKTYKWIIRTLCLHCTMEKHARRLRTYVRAPWGPYKYSVHGRTHVRASVSAVRSMKGY